MIRKTFFERLQTLLKGLAWPTSAAKVFGDNVWVVPTPPIVGISQMVSPAAYLLDGGFSHFSESPKIGTQKFSLYVFVENVGQDYGQPVLLGANATANSSRGQGFYSIMEQVQKNVIDTIALTDAVMIVEESVAKPQLVSGNPPLIYISSSYSVLLEAFT